MKFRITVNHVFVFDTNHEDNKENVQEALAAGDAEEGDEHDPDQLRDCIEYMLQNDLPSVIDVNEIDETDCTVEVMK